MQLVGWSSSRSGSLALKITILMCVAVVTIATAQDKPSQSQDPAPQTSAQPAKPADAASKGAPEAGVQANADQGDNGNSQGHNVLRLGNGDLVEVSVYNVPELTSKARVSSSGDVYLPLIDYVHVAGLTPDEAQQVIEKKLADGGFVKSPHVSIFVDEYASQGASVLGEVARPGVYPVMGQVRLFDLISAAGGLTDRSGNSATITHRSQPEKPITLPLERNLTDPQSNVEMSPGDTVVIRRADIIYVVGDVARPSGLLIDRGSMTVLQAIALAGGTTRTSRLNGTRILHKGQEGISEKHIELKKILEAKAPDVNLTADDILFVPSSAIKLALQDNASIAMQAASVGLVAVR